MPKTAVANTVEPSADLTGLDRLVLIVQILETVHISTKEDRRIKSFFFNWMIHIAYTLGDNFKNL